MPGIGRLPITSSVDAHSSTARAHSPPATAITRPASSIAIAQGPMPTRLTIIGAPVCALSISRLSASPHSAYSRFPSAERLSARMPGPPAKSAVGIRLCASSRQITSPGAQAQKSVPRPAQSAPAPSSLTDFPH